MNLTAILSFVLTFFLATLVQAIQTNYQETFVLPQYTYIEFLRTTVKLLESEYEPGSISAFLQIQGAPLDASQVLTSSNQQKPLNFNQTITTAVSDPADKNDDPIDEDTYDLLFFSDPQNQFFTSYLTSMQNHQWVQSEFLSMCIPCDTCVLPITSEEPISQVDFTNFARDKTMCCLNCKMKDVIEMNILGLTDSMSFNSLDSLPDTPMIIIVDNTPFPDGSAVGLKELQFNSQYSISISPNEQYFTATLILCIVFGGVILIGSVVILSMRRQYVQAKAEEVTRNLVNPENKGFKKQN